MRKHSYFNNNKKNIKCEVSQGIMGMSIYSFSTVNYTRSSFSVSKTVNLKVFYSKITLNVT